MVHSATLPAPDVTAAGSWEKSVRGTEMHSISCLEWRVAIPETTGGELGFYAREPTLQRTTWSRSRTGLKTLPQIVE
jgi:hypothetical protein